MASMREARCFPFTDGAPDTQRLSRFAGGQLFAPILSTRIYFTTENVYKAPFMGLLCATCLRIICESMIYMTLCGGPSFFEIHLLILKAKL